MRSLEKLDALEESAQAGLFGDEGVAMATVKRIVCLANWRKTQRPLRSRQRVVRRTTRWVTDPGYERSYLAQADGDYRIGECLLTVSLGEPYNDACYKLIAAIVHPDERLEA